MELFLHKGVSTHSAGKIHHVASRYDENAPSWRRKTSMGNHPTFGFAPKAEPFSVIPNHKLIRYYSLAHRGSVIRSYLVDLVETVSSHIRPYFWLSGLCFHSLSFRCILTA